MHYEIADYVLDIAQNARESGARNVSVKIAENPARVVVTVTDDGKGMDGDECAKALDPFYTDGKKHPGRKVGLGLPFLKQAAGQCNGSFSLVSEKGKGTKVEFSFDRRNVDCPPVGDMGALMVSLLSLPGSGQMIIDREKAGETDGNPFLSYRLDRDELIGILGDLEHVSSLILLKEYVLSQENG